MGVEAGTVTQPRAARAVVQGCRCPRVLDKRILRRRILVVQTDNGAEFQSGFHRHLEEQDIRHVHIRPRTPT